MTLGASALMGVGFSSQQAIELVGSSTALTATAGATQATAQLLTMAMNYFGTVATQLDGAKLPFAQPGGQVTVINGDSKDAMLIFGSGSDTVHGIAGATGYVLAPGRTAVFNAPIAAAWFADMGS